MSAFTLQNKQYRNYLTLSILNALFMMVGGADIAQSSYAYIGLIGGLGQFYMAYGIVYLILGFIYLIIDFLLIRKNPIGFKASMAFAIIALIMAVLWLPAGLLSMVVSIGAIYYKYKYLK